LTRVRAAWHPKAMRVDVRPILLSACLISMLGTGMAEAQTPSMPPLQAQQTPARKPEPRKREEPPKPTPLQAPSAKPPLVRPPVAKLAPATEAVLPLPLPPIPPNMPAPAAAPPKPTAEKPANPGEAEKPPAEEEKLPRFASLRSDDVNMRVGPGMRYPIQWIYKRRDLPVEITRQFDVWRYVRDADGVQGWMQGATLIGRRTFIIHKADATLRADPRDDAAPVAILNVGVIGRIRSCEASSDWCQVQASSYRGYLRREQFWGTLPHEAVGP
jgi:SH3-like domain-containing protein